GHGPAQGSGGGGVKAEDGQFGVEAAAVSWALAFAWQRGAVKGGKPQDQPAQQADTAAVRFALAEGATGLFYFFWAASPQAGFVAAGASRPAAQRSANCWKTW